MLSRPNVPLPADGTDKPSELERGCWQGVGGGGEGRGGVRAGEGVRLLGYIWRTRNDEENEAPVLNFNHNNYSSEKKNG